MPMRDTVENKPEYFFLFTKTQTAANIILTP